jgi:hypothetical protein
MEFVSIGRWGDLRPGVNVLAVNSDLERADLVRMFESVFGGSPAIPFEAPVATISGSTISLDSGLRRTMFEHLSGISPIVSARSSTRAVQPAAVSVESALAVIRSLSEPSASPREATVEVFRRMSALEDEASQNSHTADHSTRGDLASARRDVAALKRWIEELAEGFQRIEQAQVVVVSHEAAAYKKFAGPSAFNRLLDAQAARDTIVSGVGFESYEVYLSEKGTVLSDAAHRLEAHQRQLNELEAQGVDRRERSFRPVTAEMDFLAAHVHFEERYGADPTKSLAEQLRSRTVIRQGFRHQLALFLDSIGAGGHGEVEAVAQRYLDSSKHQGEAVAASRMELMIKGRIEALNKVTAFAPVPCVLDDVFSGWAPPMAHEVFSQLLETAKAGNQIIYLCTREEAARISPLTQLFERSPAFN